jgi:hypothetical protein
MSSERTSVSVPRSMDFNSVYELIDIVVIFPRCLYLYTDVMNSNCYPPHFKLSCTSPSNKGFSHHLLEGSVTGLEGKDDL